MTKSNQPIVTLKDQFAMAALHGLLAQEAHPKAHGEYRNPESFRRLAVISYLLADSMMEEREK